MSVCRWGCTALAVLVVGAAVGSKTHRYHLEYGCRGRYRIVRVMVGDGQLIVSRFDGPASELHATGWSWHVFGATVGEWGFEKRNRAMGWVAGVLVNQYPVGTTVVHEYGTTLVYPFVLAAGAAGGLGWARLRGLGGGGCQKCGYDRAGLGVGAKCPECGAGAAT